MYDRLILKTGIKVGKIGGEIYENNKKNHTKQ